MMTPRSVTVAFVCWGAAVAVHLPWIDEPSAGISLQAASGSATQVLMEKESLYHYIRVTQTGNVRRLQFRRSGDDFDESAIDISDPLLLPLDYYHVMLAGFATNRRPSRCSSSAWEAEHCRWPYTTTFLKPRSTTWNSTRKSWRSPNSTSG